MRRPSHTCAQVSHEIKGTSDDPNSMTANDDRGHDHIGNGRRNGTPDILPSRIVGTVDRTARDMGAVVAVIFLTVQR